MFHRTVCATKKTKRARARGVQQRLYSSCDILSRFLVGGRGIGIKTLSARRIQYSLTALELCGHLSPVSLVYVSSSRRAQSYSQPSIEITSSSQGSRPSTLGYSWIKLTFSGSWSFFSPTVVNGASSVVGWITPFSYQMIFFPGAWLNLKDWRRRLRTTSVRGSGQYQCIWR